MQLHEVFTKTVDVLNTRGWCKGNCRVNGSNPVCVVIGIRAVLGLSSSKIWSLTGQDNGVVETYDKAIYTLARSLGVKHEEAIYEWNDTIERTKEQVTSHLLTLAAICKAQSDDSVSIEDIRNMKEESRRDAINTNAWICFDLSEEMLNVESSPAVNTANHSLTFIPVRPMVVHTSTEPLEMGSYGSPTPPRKVPASIGLIEPHGGKARDHKALADATAPQA